MKVLKNLSLMVLLALAFAAVVARVPNLPISTNSLRSEYASGFKIERADGRQSVLVPS